MKSAIKATVATTMQTKARTQTTAITASATGSARESEGERTKEIACEVRCSLSMRASETGKRQWGKRETRKYLIFCAFAHIIKMLNKYSKANVNIYARRQPTKTNEKRIRKSRNPLLEILL